MNSCFVEALLRQPHTRTPVWMMRQAGRYLPEYRELRKQAPNFVDFCKTPELAGEAMLQPLRRFDFDASILFSDILTVPDAMGLPVEFIADVGPVFKSTIRSQDDLKQLHAPDVKAELGFVVDVIDFVKPKLSVPLIGFSGSPWTVACYMVEGCGSKTFKNVKQLMYSEPKVLHALLEQITTTTIQYLNMQIEAGANAIQVFDTWGGVLTEAMYAEFSLQYLTKIAQGVHREWQGKKVPLIFFTKGGAQWLEAMVSSGADALGLDWTANIEQAFVRVGSKVALQGNLDPFTLYGSKEAVTDGVNTILAQTQGQNGFVFNLGHGIDKDTPIEAVDWMMEAIRAI